MDINPLIEKEVGKFLSSYAEERLNKYSEAKQSIDEFRTLLEDVAKTLSESRQNLDNQENHSLVIIIDELDRCRPTYAIELLETAKHLFAVDNIVFVLGINIAEMTHSIKALYGSDFDAEGYLRRFINLDYPLPDPNPEVVFDYTPWSSKVHK